MVKRSLSETESMDVDEDGPHKKAKLLKSGEIVDEEVSDGSKRVALVPMKAVQVSKFSFKNVEGDVDSSELCHVFKSKEDLKEDLKASYMEKRPLVTAQNTLNFLNSLSYQKLQELGIKDRVSIVMWAKKIIHKHHLIKTVHDKSEGLLLQVNSFKQEFKELFEDGFPSF